MLLCIKKRNSSITFSRHAKSPKRNSFCELNKPWLHSSLSVVWGHIVLCLIQKQYIIKRRRGGLDSMKQGWDNCTRNIQIINSLKYFVMRTLVSKSPQHYLNDLGTTKQPWNAPVFKCVLINKLYWCKWDTKLVASGPPAYYCIVKHQ